MRKLVIGSVLVLGALVGGIALADDDNERKRRDLIDKIDDALEYAASELSGFESDSDDGDLRDALSYISQVESLVGELDRVKDSDSKANDMVSRYPRYISDFRQAAGYLGKLKAGQRLADGAGDKCTNDEANLQTLIRNYVAKPDDADEAMTKLPEKANEYQKVWQPLMETWKRHDGDMANHASYARFSVSDGEWSDVSSSMYNSVNYIHTYWRERYALAERHCPRLVLGEKHPDVEKALADLKSYTATTKDTVTQLKKDYNVWLKEARKVREMSTTTRDEIRKAMCEAGEYEVAQKVNEVADKWARDVASALGTLTGQGDRLVERANADKLKKYKGSAEVRGNVAKQIETLQKLKSYEMLGANNPKVKARLEWGNKRHDELQGSIGCQYKEAKVEHCNNAIRPGSGCRADCVVVSGSTCRVVEIKPDSSKGKEEGRPQVQAYTKGFRDWFAADRKGLFETYPEMKRCAPDDTLRIDDDVVFYDFCSGTVTNELGEKIDELSSDAPETSD